MSAEYQRVAEEIAIDDAFRHWWRYVAVVELEYDQCCKANTKSGITCEFRDGMFAAFAAGYRAQKKAAP